MDKKYISIICYNKEEFLIKKKILKYFTIFDGELGSYLDFSQIKFFTKPAIENLNNLMVDIYKLNQIKNIDNNTQNYIYITISETFIKLNLKNIHNCDILLLCNFLGLDRFLIIWLSYIRYMYMNITFKPHFLNLNIQRIFNENQDILDKLFENIHIIKLNIASNMYPELEEVFNYYKNYQQKMEQKIKQEIEQKIEQKKNLNTKRVSMFNFYQQLLK